MKRMMHILTIVLLTIVSTLQPVYAYDAEEVDLTIQSKNDDYTEALTDANYLTTESINKTDFTIESTTPFEYLYIEWDVIPSAYKIECDDKTYEAGNHSFLHEVIHFDDVTRKCTIKNDQKLSIANIYGYTKGTLPSDIQQWHDPSENADFLFFSTHADDEILFLGGAMATYANLYADIQVAYLCEFYSTAPIREHEKLDGLWAIGVTRYPISGDFEDIHTLSLEDAKEYFDYDEAVSYVTSVIRRCKPKVLVTQDLDGEYGHGAHMFLASAVTEAITKTNDVSFDKDSAEKYGLHEVKKTYLHLYKKNQIKLDLHKPLERFNNKTAIDVASAAYKMHVSQQIWDTLYVTDDPEDENYEYYDASSFGLYQTTVGEDTTNNMLEHIDDVSEAVLQNIPMAVEDPFKDSDPNSAMAPTYRKYIYITGLALLCLGVTLFLKSRFK